MNEIARSSRLAEANPPPSAPSGHPAITHGRIGVLLLNLGTPDATGYFALRRYLKEFLSDRRVIELTPLVWWPILNGIVLSKRPFTSGEAYRSIWNKERNESPLKTFTRGQAEKLGAALMNDSRIMTDWAMRYGNPSIKSRLDALRRAGCDRILLFPLYPQYAAATTATACDKAFDALKTMRWQPSIRVVPPYFDDPDYIAALAASIRANLAKLDFEPETMIASFHGLPKAFLEKGDPYHCHCVKTARLLREALGWPEERLRLAFQSRFGRAEWLQPYTAEAIARLAGQGVRKLAVVTPGFASDCVETLEEIAIRGAETFYEHGGEKFAALPCLNDTPESVAALASIGRRELRGWSE